MNLVFSKTICETQFYGAQREHACTDDLSSVCAALENFWKKTSKLLVALEQVMKTQSPLSTNHVLTTSLLSSPYTFYGQEQKAADFMTILFLDLDVQ